MSRPPRYDASTTDEDGYQPYRAEDGWRWRRWADNHHDIIGDSAEAYTRKWNVKRAIKRAKTVAALDAIDEAWALLLTVDWNLQSDEWREAATAWRDEYHNHF